MDDITDVVRETAVGERDIVAFLKHSDLSVFIETTNSRGEGNEKRFVGI